MMARAKLQAIEPRVTPVEAAPAAPKITKTQAVRNALKANRTLPPKEIAALLRAEGWDVKPAFVSVVKSNMGAATRKKKAATAPPPEAAGPAVPQDAVSLGLLQKAKKLAAQLGGIKEAKQALDALAQLMD